MCRLITSTKFRSSANVLLLTTSLQALESTRNGWNQYYLVMPLDVYKFLARLGTVCLGTFCCCVVIFRAETCSRGPHYLFLDQAPTGAGIEMACRDEASQGSQNKRIFILLPIYDMYSKYKPPSALAVATQCVYSTGGSISRLRASSEALVIVAMSIQPLNLLTVCSIFAFDLLLKSWPLGVLNDLKLSCRSPRVYYSSLL